MLKYLHFLQIIEPNVKYEYVINKKKDSNVK